MYTIQDILKQFGEKELSNLYKRIEFMLPNVRQQFIDACIFYKTRPGAGWNGGHYGDPFIPVTYREVLNGTAET